ncbi:E3 ubiquitin protein ligase [Phaffia rhodozyma]|uniref:HECT-type E3 ubiquitin transferase n=1 Tax=Phaffia rhodozyma TaxID=264483 RepID=A0A0F7SUK8_PHARH|nr:E3 ubiquitin protein ligase [Phaffia rhodozyma]
MNHHYFTGSTRAPKNINLSSGQSSSSAQDVLQRAALERQTRDDQRRKDASARVVQRIYRSSRERHRLYTQWRSQVSTGQVAGIDALRMVVFGWGADGMGAHADEKAWWSAVGQGKPPIILLPLHAPTAPRYIVLLKLLSFKLLQLASTSSHSRETVPQLAILPLILDVSSYKSVMTEADAQTLNRELSDYLARRNVLGLIRRALMNISPTDKKHPNLPSLIASLAHLLNSNSLPELLPSLISEILSIPLLPNRLPIPSLTLLAKSLDLKSILSFIRSPAFIPENVLPPRGDHTSILDTLGNFAAFGAGQVAKWNTSEREAWASLLGQGLLSRLSGWVIEGRPVSTGYTSMSGGRAGTGLEDTHESLEDRQFRPQSVGRKSGLNTKLLAHLSLLIQPAHLSALTISLTLPVVQFVLALLSTWPEKRETVLTLVGSARKNGGVIKELWRTEVRAGPVMRRVLDLGGKNGGKAVLDALHDPKLASSWPPFILLTLLHTHLLLSLGDDEFFSSTINPLTLSETTLLSSLWRNVAFALYWNPLPTSDSANTPTDSPEWLAGWRVEGVREIMRRSMASVYERDQRKPFVGDGGWLMSESFDTRGFVEAAITEEQDLDSINEEDSANRMDVDPDPNTTGPPVGIRSFAKKMMTKRRMAFLSPRLGVLNNIPQTIPFELRVEIFRAFIRNDKARLGIDRYSRRSPKYQTTIRRDKVAEDGYSKLNAIGAGLKGTISIEFIDRFGQPEAGIDGGGVFKEFLTSLSAEVFNTDRGLWQATKQQELYPAPTNYATESHQLDWYQFIGRVLGKALYEGTLVDVSLAGFFLKKWLGRQCYLDDLSSLDLQLYDGLIKLKTFDGNVEELALTFTIDVEEFGVTTSVDLIPDGASVPVTNENRLKYIDLVAAYKLNTQIKKQSEAFFLGLADIIEPKWIRMFDQRELQMLLGGVDTEIDLVDLKRNSVSHGLSETTETAFWNVVSRFNGEEKRALIKFVTSCPRPPMLGFKELDPLFCIRAGASDTTRLPSSATCVNMLKLPPYTDEATLRAKLLTAITSEAGFDLS